MMIHDKISLPCWLFGFKMLIETILMYGGTYLIYIYIYIRYVPPYINMWRIEEGNTWPAGDERVRDVHAFILWWFCHLALYIMWSLHMPWIRWNHLCPVISLSLGNQWIWFPHYYYGWMIWILWKIGENILIYWYYVQSIYI